MTFDPRLTGPRIEKYWVEVLDSSDSLIAALPAVNSDATTFGVLDGTVTYNVDATVQSGASLELLNVPDSFNWGSWRFKIWVSANGISWPLGVYLPAKPDTEHSATAAKSSASLLDKTSILDARLVGQTFSVAAGQNVVSNVTQILTVLFGESNVAITPSSKTLSTALTWSPGDSYLKVVNDLLSAIAYNNLWADRFGQFRAEPWVDPASQQPAHVFARGETAIHLPTFTVSQDVSGVPNEVVCLTAGTDTTAGMYSRVTNEDASSPYSYQARQRWVSAVYTDVAAADQATLDTIAHQHLVDSMSPAWYASVSHAAVPLDARDVVQFTSGDVDRVCWVNEWAYSSLKAPGALMTGKWKAVTA